MHKLLSSPSSDKGKGPDKGSHVHRGTQQVEAAKSTSESAPSSSTTPFDIPSSSSASSKRHRSVLDISTRSSASSKRRKPSANADVGNVMGAYERLIDRLEQYTAQESSAPLLAPAPVAMPAPVPVPVPAPMPVHAHTPPNPGERAAGIFYDRFMHSKSSGDEWLSMADALKVFEIFRTDSSQSAATYYLILIESPISDESFVRSWVLGLLRKHDS